MHSIRISNGPSRLTSVNSFSIVMNVMNDHIEGRVFSALCSGLAIQKIFSPRKWLQNKRLHARTLPRQGEYIYGGSLKTKLFPNDSWPGLCFLAALQKRQQSITIKASCWYQPFVEQQIGVGILPLDLKGLRILRHAFFFSRLKSFPSPFSIRL